MNEFEYFLYGPARLAVVRGDVNIKNQPAVEKEADHFEIKCVLSNREKGVFTVKWTDGTVTMVTCQPGDDWDDEKALAMCFMKKALGNKGAFNDVMRDALDKMAVISEKKNVVPAVAPAETKAQSDFSEAMDRLHSHAAEAGKNMKKAIAKLLNENINKEEKHYQVFLRTNLSTTPAANFTDLKALKKFVSELAREQLGVKPFYYRAWGDDNEITVDFGSHYKFIVIKGMSITEWHNA
jgi:hypothetical protein